VRGESQERFFAAQADTFVPPKARNEREKKKRRPVPLRMTGGAGSKEFKRTNEEMSG
jgi:hypothetical protein